MNKPLNLVWIRRDMRLHDHRALAAALKEEGDVQLVFIFDKEILDRFSNKDDRRISFLADILTGMEAELHKHGGSLLVLHGKASKVMPELCHALKPSKLFAARDVEPANRNRDRVVFKDIKDLCEMVAVEDHLILFPERVLKDDGKPYAVFTPYSRKWHATLHENDCQEAKIAHSKRYAKGDELSRRASAAGLNVIPAKDAKSMVEAIGYRYVETGHWKPSDAKKRLNVFMDNAVGDYPKQRDIPGVDGTSKLSPYLRFGVLSVRECLRAAQVSKNSEKWISELIWRDFYAMILYHFPDVVNLEFQPKFRDTLDWSTKKAHLQSWAEGQTGYPFVDAAMRQLLQEGWMHNRARMVVASFLVKDLHIDWRWGEEHFAQWLMDYDLASNNGGWQWSASTGTDAQPWFRIFNPIEQSKRFDPNGDYIRQYVPELKKLENNYIHEPWKAKISLSYPKPIVDHAESRKKTLAMFKAVG